MKEYNLYTLSAYLQDYISMKHAELKRPIIVQILGCAGSGKSHLARTLKEKFEKSVIVASDDYNQSTHERRAHMGGNPFLEKDFKFMGIQLTKLASLKPNESLDLPEYNPGVGLALALGLRRKISGPVDYIIIDSNFYLKAMSIQEPDLLIYLHMQDEERLKVRIIRDLTPGQMRVKNKQELIKQFNFRKKKQDRFYTKPFKGRAHLFIEATPNIEGDSIKGMIYHIPTK